MYRFIFLLIYSILLSFSSISQFELTYNLPEIEKIIKHPLKQFSSKSKLEEHLQELRATAYKKGYVQFSLDSLQQIDSTHYSISGEIGKRYSYISYHFDETTTKWLKQEGIAVKQYGYSKAIPILFNNHIQNLLKDLDKHGFPFAQLSFSEVVPNEKNIELTVTLRPGGRVLWSKLHLIGKELAISDRFISNYLHIEIGSEYSQETIDLIPIRLSQLNYLSQPKPAELLFTKEGAELFLYLESRPVSLLNGTVGLQQNPLTLNYQLTGDFRLKLQNALRRGELIDLNWKSIQPGSPQVKLLVSLPYLFNTPFGVDGQFQLFKRDSSFLELTATAGVNYFLSGGNILKAFYRYVGSSVLSGGAKVANLGSASSNRYGLGIVHQTIDYLPNPRRGMLWNLEGTVGQRKLTKDSVTTTSLILGGKLTVEGYVPITKRQVLKLALTSETYTAPNLQQNELLRFGGNSLQRGFLEDELLASTRATATVEYRLILEQNSYLFVFFDQSWYERSTQLYFKDLPYGFGGGISFGTNIGIFSLTYALGSQQGNGILFRDGKVHFGYVAYF